MKQMKTIIIFITYIIAYSILLFTKYIIFPTEISIRTVVEGYFMVNGFFAVMLIPIGMIHNELKKKEYFINVTIFSKAVRLLSLAAATGVLIFFYKLPMPLDVMSSILVWLFLYFSTVLK